MSETRDPQHVKEDRTQHSSDDGLLDTTFNVSRSGEPIPDSPGVKTTPGSGHNTQTGDPTPLSQDVDPIHQFEEEEDFTKSAPLVPGRADSPSSGVDAGIDPEADLPVAPLNFSQSANYRGTITPDDLDDESFALETADLNENLDEPLVQEIPMATLDIESIDDAKTQNTLDVGEMDPANAPGEIDIEALGDNAIDDLLPPDARLDPIEE